jgi:hypothetical protein
LRSHAEPQSRKDKDGQPRIHHAAPLVVARGVFAFLSDGLADPLFELRLGEVVVVDPPLVAGVVGRVDIDALDFARVSREQRLERQQVVPLDDQVSIKRRLGPFGQQRELGIELQPVMGHRVVIGLDDGFALEVQRWHRIDDNPTEVPLKINPCREMDWAEIETKDAQPRLFALHLMCRGEMGKGGSGGKRRDGQRLRNVCPASRHVQAARQGARQDTQGPVLRIGGRGETVSRMK